MKRIINLGLLLLLMLGGQAFGQTVRVTGTVTDANDGSTLPGVTVAVKGTSQGTVTNIEGRYELSTTGDAVLVFSFIGMRTQEIAVEGRSVIDVAMELDIQALGEVVVIGYGTARAVGTVVGSISTVGSAQLESRPAGNALDALQGQVAGLQVFTSSGAPTETSSVRLHGIGSLGASSVPLYVLDGVPIATGNILSLNPNDIESVTVLKDASATSIYGSRAANGVIYITTKRGHRDEKAQVRVNSQYGVSSLANKDYFNDFMNTRQLTDYWVETGFRTQEQVETLLEQYPNDTRWNEYFYADNAPTYQGDVSIQGGGGRTTYYVSGGYFYQDGIATRSEYERYSFRANINSHANDWLSFGTNIGLGHDNRQVNPMHAGGTWLGYGLMELLQPYYTPYDEDGERYDFIPGVNMLSPFYREIFEPATGNNAQFNLTGYLQLNPIQGLTIRSQVGLDAYDYRSTSIRKPSHLEHVGNGVLTEYFSRVSTRSITNTAEYKFNVDVVHDFTILGGQEYVDNQSGNFTATTSGLTDDRIILLPSGDPDTRNVNQAKSEYAYSSFFGRFDYGYDRKYFVDFSLRQDESSRFGRFNRTATFWAAGVMWNAKRESFMQNVEFLSSFRFRTSIGTSGNSQIANYGHLATIGSSTPYAGSTSWLISSPGNPRLTWEDQLKLTIGTDFSMASDRYRFKIDYYRRTTRNMLMSVPQPYTSGFNNITENVGSLRNSGVDVDFNFDLAKGSDFFVTPHIRFNYNTTEVTELFHGLDSWVIPNTSIAYVVGQPVRFYAPIFAGIDPEDGAPMWYVPGEDRAVTTRDETTKVFVEADLEQNIGKNRYAPISGGIGLNAGWRNFSIQTDFSFVMGQYLLNNDRYFSENPTVFAGFNQLTTVTDYWKEPGDQTTFPAYGTQFTQFDSRLIEEASFVRLKNLTLSYQLPTALLQRTNIIEGSRIFITGRNLLTFTNYRGKDPEVDSNIAFARNPNTRQIAVGISLTL